LSRPDSHGSAARKSVHGIGAARPDNRDVPEEEAWHRIGAEKHIDNQRYWHQPGLARLPRFRRLEGANEIFQRSDTDAPSPGATSEFDLMDDMPDFLRRRNDDRNYDRGATTVRAIPLQTKGTADDRPPQSAPENTEAHGWRARL
jgi:hypothetical protein